MIDTPTSTARASALSVAATDDHQLIGRDKLNV